MDPEMQKQFDELQKRMVETRAQLQHQDMQTRMKSSAIKHRELTAVEVDRFPDDVKMYNGIGRMFLLESKSETMERLQDEMGSLKSSIEDMKKNKVYLERVYKDSEGNLREMLRHR
eukprot:m.87470 g.87470  ORF g.87470 m.87470 type:complete len:116 (+) comp16408_c1_seq3:133-480(+)